MDRNGNQVALRDIFEAFDACIKHKRRTYNAQKFELDLERNCIQLCRELNDGTYQIGTSIAFIVDRPVKREVFAADFRDRVVHDWMCIRINPLLESVLTERMMSNRKGKGSLAAIEQAEADMREVSEGYTKDAWIWKLDLKGFFMSIDKRIVEAKLQRLIDEKYDKPDKEVLKRVCRQVIMHCPQNNCIRKSKPQAWEGLRADKSLFTQDEFHGLAIGNLPSQLLANFLLSDMVKYLEAHGFTHYVQYVDDVLVIHHSKKEILDFIPKLRAWLGPNLGVSLHPNKCYIQHYTKGVSFVGGLIKPYRKYISKRTRHRFFAKVHWLVTTKKKIDYEKMQATVNSYLGISQHFAGYNLRKKAAEKLFARFHSEIYFGNNLNKMRVVKSSLFTH